MSEPVVTANFHKGLDTCDITITQDGKEASFSNLRVKKTNLRDWNEPQVVYQVFIPCRKALGRDYMACFGRGAVFGYVHNERKPLVLRATGKPTRQYTLIISGKMVTRANLC